MHNSRRHRHRSRGAKNTSLLSRILAHRAERSREREIVELEKIEAAKKVFGTRTEVTRRQQMLTAGTALTLVWTTWALSGQTPFTLSVSVIFAALTFSLLFIPNGEFRNKEEIRRNCREIQRFPLFWIGLRVFAYMIFQTLNPAIVVEFQGSIWKLRTLKENVAFPNLPTGIDAPFSGKKISGNAWRQLCIFGSAWLLLNALWVGLHSRRMWKLLLWIFTGNALALAFLGFSKIASGKTTLFNYKFAFFSTFSYENHAGEFFLLAIAVCVALGLDCWKKAVREGKRGGVHLPLIVCGLILFGTVFATKSVGATLLGAIWMPLSVALILSTRLISRDSWIAISVFVLMLGGLAGTWCLTTNTNVFFSKFDQKASKGELPTIENTLGVERAGTEISGVPAAKKVEKFSLEKGDRADLRKLSWKMFHYSSHVEIFGWGAGSYRWVAPAFQKTMPEFTRKNKEGKTYLPTRTEYAHCDPLQILVELGAVGFGIVTSGVLWLAFFAAKNFRRFTVQAFALFAGTLFFAAHSCVDFVSYNPALILCLAFLIAGFKAFLRAPRERL